MDTKQRLLQLLKDLSVKRGQFTLASGKTSDLYIDSKQTSLHCEGATLIGEVIFEHVQQLRQQGHAIVGVGGITMGADPIATAAAVISHQKAAPVHAFIIRKEPKGYGTGQWVEGMRNLPHNASVLIVEDVVTTGGSTVKAVERARESGLLPVAIVALVDRLEGGRENLATLGLPFTALFTRHDF
jgi:orotate phosphoribosyltransferase